MRYLSILLVIISGTIVKAQTFSREDQTTILPSQLSERIYIGMSFASLKQVVDVKRLSYEYTDTSNTSVMIVQPLEDDRTQPVREVVYYFHAQNISDGIPVVDGCKLFAIELRFNGEEVQNEYVQQNIVTNKVINAHTATQPNVDWNFHTKGGLDGYARQNGEGIEIVGRIGGTPYREEIDRLKRGE